MHNRMLLGEHASQPLSNHMSKIFFFQKIYIYRIFLWKKILNYTQNTHRIASFKKSITRTLIASRWSYNFLKILRNFPNVNVIYFSICFFL